MTNATKTKATREKAAAMRAEAARREARARNTRIVAVVAAVLAVVVAAGIIIQTARHDQQAAAGATPRNTAGGSAIVVGRAEAPVTVLFYEDFQCPVCKEAHQANDAQLDQWVKDGKVKVQYQPIAFLDRASTDEYSTRALNAAAAVIDLHPAGFEAFQQSLYDHQPAENGAGLTDQQLIDYAVAAGAPREEVTTDVHTRRFAGWVKEVTDESSRRGVTGTPTIKVNGTALSDWQPDRFKAAVEAAAKG
jgi:protein-disulfide isomerase